METHPYQRSGLFDAPIRKEMVEGEIVDQHNHNSHRLTEKLRRMYEGKKGKFQQEGQQRAHDTRRVKAQAALQPGAFCAGQANESEAVVRQKVGHDRTFCRDDKGKDIVHLRADTNREMEAV